MFQIKSSSTRPINGLVSIEAIFTSGNTTEFPNTLCYFEISNTVRMHCEYNNSATWIHANVARTWKVSRNFIEIILPFSTLQNDSSVSKGFIDNYCVWKGVTVDVLKFREKTKQNAQMLFIHRTASYTFTQLWVYSLTSTSK